MSSKAGTPAVIVHRGLVRAAIAFAFVAAMCVVASRGRAALIIQPGAEIQAGSTLCTLAWIYDGTGSQAGNVFAGTAGHCVSGAGQRVSVFDSSSSAKAEFGTVALDPSSPDYALIKVDGDKLSNVDPTMRGHPSIPQGVSTVSTAKIGDSMQFSGYGVGTGATQPTREDRQGTLGYNDGTQHYIYAPVTPGDSGGPVADLTDGDKAFGIVTTLGAATTPSGVQAGEGGVSLDGMLASAAASGFPVRVRTLGGAAPTATPAGSPSPGSSPSPTVAPGSNPALSVSDADAGRRRDCSFTVRLTPAASGLVSVDYETRDLDGDASFTPAQGTLTFAPGESQKNVVVFVEHRRTSDVELVLSNANGASIQDGTGTCTIDRQHRRRRGPR
jgi:hypothetical protein